MQSPSPRQIPTDPLTGLTSRRRFLEEAVSEFRKYQRYRHTFTLLIVDIDQFDQVNTRHGTETGDRILVGLAAALTGLLREHDLTGRIGGEEFGVLLIETSTEAAAGTAERLRQVCRELTFPVEDGMLSVSVSIGLSEVLPTDNSFETVFSRADKALSHAKANGRDRVELG